MSNFPIIPTTPPPLDVNDSTTDDDLDVHSLHDSSSSPEPENVTTFDDNRVIDNNKTNVMTPSTDPQSSCNNNDNNIQVKDTVFNNNITDDSINTIISDINNLNVEDIDSNDNSLNIQDLELDPIDDNNLKDINDDNITDISLLNEPQNIEKLNDNLEIKEKKEEVVNEFKSNEYEDNEESEFADFASFNDNNWQQKTDNQIANEDQSFSFYKSDISFDERADTSNIDSNNLNLKSSELQISGNNVTIHNDSDDEEFADFESSQPVFQTDIQSTFEQKNDFSEQQTLEFADNDEEFADFTSFQSIGSKQESSIYCAPNDIPIIDENQDISKLSKLFAQMFSIEESNVSSDDNSIVISKDFFNNTEENSKTLWKRLQDLESAPSLKHRWPNSHSFHLLLAALNIDPRNILRNSSVPMFASGLGYVLEPTKHLAYNESNDGIENDVINTDLSTTSIPPVQFDWSSSGLKNPLDVNEQAKGVFDLDFFITSDDINKPNNSNIFSDFDNFLNDTNGNTCDMDSTSSNDLPVIKTNLMQQILTSVGNTTSTVKSDTNQVLSAEALQVLDELPNLSFMRAKVLMFPIINNKT